MTQPQSPYFAAVDLGSNSFHMIICRVNDQSVEVLDRVKDMVQIARGMSGSGIASDAQQRAIDCLSRFAERLRGIPPEQIRAVGTKSLRSAKNSAFFLAEAEQALGHPIDIISGYEEARLVYKGLFHSVANDSTKRLVIDIGGASTEFIIGDSNDPILLESLSFGCVSATEMYGLRNEITRQHMNQVYLSVCADIEAIRLAYLRTGWDIVYGTSGTMKAVADLLAEADGGAIIRASSLNDLYHTLIDNPEHTLKSVTKLRRDVLPAGIALLRAIFDELRIDKIHVADASLKDGLIYDTLGRLNNVDAREHAVAALQQQYRVDQIQASRVAQASVQLLRQIDTPSLPGVSRTKILTWAAQLHETGLGISHSSHHNHGYYILRHSDLAGFGRYEQYILASLVRCHRKKLHADRLEGLDQRAKLAILPLVLCLRLAVILSRRREDLEFQPTLSGFGEKYVVKFPTGWLTNNPLTAEGLRQEPLQFANLGVEFIIREN